MGNNPPSPPRAKLGRGAKPLPRWGLAALVAVAIVIAVASYYLITPYLHHQAVDGDVLPMLEEADPGVQAPASGQPAPSE